MSSSIKISARIPAKIVEEIDKLVQRGIFSNRSDFIKEAVRYYLRELKKEELTKEEGWVLHMVQPILAEDWESEEDKFWDNY